MEKNKGTAGKGRPRLGGNTKLPPKNDAPKLDDLKITRMQSSRWQKLASVP
jgi:hypothetical protein